MIEGCLLVVWAFLLLTWVLCETWLKQFTVQSTPPPPSLPTGEQPNRQIKSSMENSCEISGGGGEKSDGVATLDGTAFSLQELHVQLKQMECMIKMLVPYKEKLEAMHHLPSLGTATSKLQSCVSDGELSLGDLCNRLKVLESENQSLLVENGNQRLKFERCLDQVAIHVAHVLLAQQTLRGECLHLHQRVFRLEQQNHQLYRFFHHQLESLRQPKDQDTHSSREHIYEIPELFQADLNEDPRKTSPDEKPNSSFSMYDSLEATFPSTLCSASYNPVATLPNQIQFGVRSQTIPPYTSSPRSRPRCTVDAGCRGNCPSAPRHKSCSREDPARVTLEEFGKSGFRRRGNRSWSENVDPDASTDLEKKLPGTKQHPGVETKYSDLEEEEETQNRKFSCESMESSVSEADLSPAADLLCLSDSFYEQFTIGNCDGELSVSKRRSAEREEFGTESDDKEFCIESDDTQSLFQGSGPLTRASSVSLSELLGRTPNTTSDSDTLSVDDYPFLDYRAKGSIIEENSNEESDYEELIVDDEGAVKSQKGSNAQNTPGARIAETPSDVGKNKETLSPSREKTGESLLPPGVGNIGFCGRSNLTRLPKHLNHCGPHINVLSRCSNKKLKSAADKICSASYRLRPVRPFHHEDSDRYSTGSTSPLDHTTSSKEPGHHPVDNDVQNRPRFLKISHFRRHPIKSPTDGRKEGEETSPAFLPSGEFLWDDRFLERSCAACSSSPSSTTSHTYVNISALNLKQKPRPLLARRKMNSTTSSRTAVHGFSKGGCYGSSVQQHKASPSKTGGGTRSRSSSTDSSPDSDVQRSVFTSSSDSETVTGEKLPSSQDDGYSSNSLPSETSSRQLVADASRLRRPVSKREVEQKAGSVIRRRTTGGIRKIVPILGRREDLLSTFEEGCEGKSDLEVDSKGMTLEDLTEDPDLNDKPLPLSVSVDVESPRVVEESYSSREELTVLDENSANETPIEEFLIEDDED